MTQQCAPGLDGLFCQLCNETNTRYVEGTFSELAHCEGCDDAFGIVYLWVGIVVGALLFLTFCWRNWAGKWPFVRTDQIVDNHRFFGVVRKQTLKKLYNLTKPHLKLKLVLAKQRSNHQLGLWSLLRSPAWPLACLSGRSSASGRSGLASRLCTKSACLIKSSRCQYSPSSPSPLAATLLPSCAVCALSLPSLKHARTHARKHTRKPANTRQTCTQTQVLTHTHANAQANAHANTHANTHNTQHIRAAYPRRPSAHGGYFNPSTGHLLP